MGPEHALLEPVRQLRCRSLRIHDMRHKQAVEYGHCFIDGRVPEKPIGIEMNSM